MTGTEIQVCWLFDCRFVDIFLFLRSRELLDFTYATIACYLLLQIIIFLKVSLYMPLTLSDCTIIKQKGQILTLARFWTFVALRALNTALMHYVENIHNTLSTLQESSKRVKTKTYNKNQVEEVYGAYIPQKCSELQHIWICVIQ